MSRILVISDTHCVNHKKVEKLLKEEQHDLSVHCGDYCDDVPWITKHFDFFCNGNNDFGGPKDHELIQFEYAGIKFIVLHGHQLYSFNYEDWLDKLHDLAKRNGCDVCLFGHSHMYEVKEYEDGIIVANPGSLALPRDHCASYMMIDIENKKIKKIHHCKLKDR
ncbi:MAG: YfcE family phosphodiesterase [Mycoplasma sp.]